MIPSDPPEPFEGRSDDPTILYVDDEPKSLKYFQRAFGDEFRVLLADSVAAADRLLAERCGQVGVLIADQRMPGETGVQLLSRAKDRYPTIVRLLTTAYAELTDAVAAVNRGEIHRYILKPWDIVSLRADLRAGLQLHRERCAELDLIQARRQTMTALASHVAHELATPLATIASAAAGLERYLPVLLDAYRRMGHTPAAPGPIPESVLRVLGSAPTTVLESANRSRVLIGLLLMNAGNASAPGESDRQVSIRSVLDEALDGYAFAPGERERVRLEGDDFAVLGSPTLLIHVLYNLIKNALDAIKSAGQGDIRILTLPGAEWHRLLVEDSGSGISPDAVPYIFDEFFTLKGPGRGAGMGLAFCRRVMESLGGGIECRSRLGAYTSMELRFPPVSGNRGSIDEESEDR
jgi:two-component system, response regulator PhcR